MDINIQVILVRSASLQTIHPSDRVNPNRPSHQLVNHSFIVEEIINRYIVCPNPRVCITAENLKEKKMNPAVKNLHPINWDGHERYVIVYMNIKLGFDRK